MKPFVHAYIKPKYSEKVIHTGKLNSEMLLKIRDNLIESKNDYVKRIACELFDTKAGRRIIKEFLYMRKKNQFRLTNF